MNLSHKNKIIISAVLFIFLSYSIVVFNAISFSLIPLFIIPVIILDYRDFEIRFIFLFFILFISLLLSRVFHNTNLSMGLNFLSFLSVFIFSLIKNSVEKSFILNREKELSKISEIKREIDDLKSQKQTYIKHRETILLNLNSRQKLISCLKDIQFSRNNDEIISNLMKSISLVFPKSLSEFIISPSSSRIAGDVFKTSTPVYIPDVNIESRYNYSCFKLLEKSIVYMPVSAFSKTIAVVKVYSDKAGYFSIDDFRTLEILCATASIAIENISLYNTTEDLARKDSLTGLFTHRAFQDKLDEEILVSSRTKKPMVLLIIDIDHFKRVNDSYGHQTGDYVLKRIASLISNNSREFDFVARYGGEEFSIIMPQTSKNEAINIAAKIRESVKEYDFIFEDKRLKATISIGMSEFPSEASSKVQIIRVADERLYKAKREGRDRIVYE